MSRRAEALAAFGVDAFARPADDLALVVRERLAGFAAVVEATAGNLAALERAETSRRSHAPLKSWDDAARPLRRVYASRP